MIWSLVEATLQEEERNYEFCFELNDVYESLKVTNFEVKYPSIMWKNSCNILKGTLLKQAYKMREEE